MIDGPSVLAIFLMVIACLLGLRWTKPVPPVRPVVQDEPRQIVSATRPLAIAEPVPLPVVPVCVPLVHTDDTIDLTPHIQAFLESLE